MSTAIELLQARMELVEEALNSVQIALTNLASAEAVNQITLLVQRDLQDVITDVEQLRRELDILKAEVYR